MGIITPNNTTQFIDTKNLFSKIKRDLKSFNSVGAIDEADMYDYAVEVLDSLGISGLKEDHVVLSIKNGKARLPNGFRTLYSAEKCTVESSSANHPRLQNSYAFYTDTSYQKVPMKGECANKCDMHVDRTKITVREYVQGLESIHNFRHECPLKLVAGIVRLDNDERPVHHQEQYIQIDNGYVYTGFKEGIIYMKYYGLALNPDNNLPLIPDIKSVVKAIEFCIKYNLFLNWYLNDTVPGGVVQKAGELKKLYEEYFAQAYSESKLPTFAGTIEQIRIMRHSQDIYRQIEGY